MKRIGKNRYSVKNSDALKTIIDPATNTEGFLLRTACLTFTNTGHSSLMIKKGTAPNQSTDIEADHILMGYGNGGQSILPEAVEVPADYGLYYDTTQSDGATMVSLTWDFKQDL